MSSEILPGGNIGIAMTVVMISVGILVGGYVFYQVADNIPEPMIVRESSLSLTPNTDLVLVSGYDAFDSVDGSGFGGVTGTRAFLVFEHDATIRQAGTVEAIRLETGDTPDQPDFDEIYFEVWHKDGTTYDLVGRTGNLIDEYEAIGANTVTTLNLGVSDQISGVVEGDRMGLRLVSSGTTGKVIANVAGDSTVATYFTDSGTTDTNFNWEAQTNVTNMPKMQYLMKAPSIVFIGDSITSGHNVHDSFIEAAGTDRGPAQTAPAKIAASLGVSHQNMGHGSPDNLSSDGLARFTEDVVDLKPKAVIIGYGTVDINNSVAQSTFISNMQSMITEAKSAGITPIIYEVYPRDYDTIGVVDAKDTNRLSFNTALNDLATTNSIRIISTDDELGDGGTPLALDAPYNDDDTHPNASGYTQIANAATAVIQGDFTTDSNSEYQAGTDMVYVAVGFLSVLVLVSMLMVFKGDLF